MCVSEWRVPLMNVTPEMIGHDPAERTASSAPRPFSTVMIVASGKRPRSDSTAPSSPAALVATMPRSNGAISVGIGRRVHARLALAAPADAQAVAAQRLGVILAPRQHRDVGDGGQMPGKEAADRTCAYDAHPLHPCCRSLRPPAI